MTRKKDTENRLLSKDCCGNTGASENSLKTHSGISGVERAAEVKFLIFGMHCGSCADKVRAALLNVAGVSGADVNLRRTSARVSYDPLQTDLAALRAVIDTAGYSAEPWREQATSAETPPVAQWWKRPFGWGAVTVMAVIAFYLSLITLTSNWSNTVYQFSEYGGWIITLALGLGMQVGLFTHMRKVMREIRMKDAASGMAVSGGMSGVAMAICCSHYLAAILPAIGLPFLSGAVAGLVEYQTVFFAFGVISNLLGIAYLIRLMAKNGVFVYGFAHS